MLQLSKKASRVVPGLFLTLMACAVEAERLHGEPVELRSNFLYFTSWKYVRQGGFSWQIARGPEATAAEQNAGAWLRGDGARPARFEPRDMPRGVRLVAQRAQKRVFDAEPAQVYDEGRYKCWYTIQPCPDEEPFSSKDRILPGHNAHVCYAESDDGFNWTTPSLNLFSYAGNTDNSIVFRGDLNGSARGYHGGSVFVDPSSVDERYKMVYLGIVTDAEWDAFAAKYPDEVDTMARRGDVGGFRCVTGLFGAVSPDGIHWEPLPEPLMIQHADTINTCYYDESRGLYVAHVRGWQVDPRAPGYEEAGRDNWIGVGRRSIARAVSTDFRHFSKAEIVVTTGADMPPSHVYYTNCKTTLPGIPDNHVMFPWIWELERDGGSVWLLSSPDGWTWSRVPGGPVVEPGLPGTPDGGHVICHGNLLEFDGDTWGIGFSGVPIPHKYPGRDLEMRHGLFPGVPSVHGLATWRRGRLVALECEEEGEFATVAVVPRGERIRVNATVRPTGYLRTAVAALGRGDLEECTFEQADPIVGDGLDMPVTWAGRGEIPHGGAPVILRFQLRQASVFGIEFY